MNLLIVLLSLAAVLQPSLEEEEEEDSEGGLLPKQQQEILDQINTFRRDVKPTAKNMQKMSWSEKAAEKAANWTKECKNTVRPQEERRVNGIICSQNMLQSSVAMAWSEVFEYWYSKRFNFKYGVMVPGSEQKIGAYTQLIWATSHQIGCAVGYCSGTDSPFLYICQFCPSGNIVGFLERPYKDGPSCADCPNNCEDRLCTNPCPYQDTTPNCKEIKKQFTCQHEELNRKCQATCNCEMPTK